MRFVAILLVPMVLATQDRPVPLNPKVVKLDNYLLEFDETCDESAIQKTSQQCFRDAADSGLCSFDSFLVSIGKAKCQLSGTAARLSDITVYMETGLVTPTLEQVEECLLDSFAQFSCEEAFAGIGLGNIMISKAAPTDAPTIAPTDMPSVSPTLNPTISFENDVVGIDKDPVVKGQKEDNLTLPLAITVAGVCAVLLVGVFLYRRRQQQNNVGAAWRSDSPVKEVPDEEVGIGNKDDLAASSEAGASTIAFEKMLEEASALHAMADDLTDNNTPTSPNGTPSRTMQSEQDVEAVLSSSNELDLIMAAVVHKQNRRQDDDASSRTSSHLAGEEIMSAVGSSVISGLDPKMQDMLDNAIPADRVSDSEKKMLPGPDPLQREDTPNLKEESSDDESEAEVFIAPETLTKEAIFPTPVQKKDLRHPYNYARELSSDSGDSLLDELDNMSQEDFKEDKNWNPDDSSVDSSDASPSFDDSKSLLTSFRAKMKWKKLDVPPEDKNRKTKIHL